MALGRFVDLFALGGLEIRTPEKDEAMRTLIQPDGDVIIWVTPQALVDANLRETHFKAVRANASLIRTLRTGLKVSWYTAVLPFLWGAYQAFAGRLREFLISLAISGLILALRAMAGWLLRWYVRRRIDRFLQGLL